MRNTEMKRQSSTTSKLKKKSRKGPKEMIEEGTKVSTTKEIIGSRDKATNTRENRNQRSRRRRLSQWASMGSLLVRDPPSSTPKRRRTRKKRRRSQLQQKNIEK